MSSREKKYTILNPSDLLGEDKSIDSHLFRQIKENGQINPITIYKESNQYRVVDGHKRVKVLRELKRTVECREIIINSYTHEVEEEIRLNSERGLTLLEKAKIVSRLIAEKTDTEEITETYLKKLKLPQKKPVLDNLIGVIKLPAKEQLFFNQKNFGEYLLHLIFNLDETNKHSFLSCAVTFNLNHNQGKELLENLIISNKPFHEHIMPWLEKASMEPEKSGYFFGLLKKSLLTVKTETAKQLNEIIQLLPNNLRLSEEDYLKNGLINLTIKAKKKTDINSVIQALEMLMKRQKN
ncbi:MAG: ParB N-terminal domain-containing protein [Nitrospinae bacterium]|nr:ParB N-terminal domain-containing protein [Nitrospinota bacterium]